MSYRKQKTLFKEKMENMTKREQQKNITLYELKKILQRTTELKHEMAKEPSEHERMMILAEAMALDIKSEALPFWE